MIEGTNARIYLQPNFYSDHKADNNKPIMLSLFTFQGPVPHAVCAFQQSFASTHF